MGSKVFVFLYKHAQLFRVRQHVLWSHSFGLYTALQSRLSSYLHCCKLHE